VWIKDQGNRDATSRASCLYHTGDDLLMAPVHAIKDADSHVSTARPFLKNGEATSLGQDSSEL
jgi:hypothetical protein